MSLDHSISDRSLPFHRADSNDCPAPIRTDVLQAIGKVALALSAQTSDTVRWDTGKYLRIETQATQELQLVEQPVCSSRVVADLELAKPDETADIGIEQFGQQTIKPFARSAIEPLRNSCIYPSFRSDQRVCT
ncbi:hypothetical protein ALP14_200143 [Pseudomonas amygdali pv. myricae]|nr:hypothetical protein ALP46_200222 [Pseudomonas amygdali pv. myricae]RMU95525.1 hypothetical protein ALP18_200160 [Pseudomonas amygdali pv. myricae]RMV22972.1 hypothetical protein ALP14_200143 [Pseudomonas amygdali pv. myricae]